MVAVSSGRVLPGAIQQPGQLLLRKKAGQTPSLSRPAYGGGGIRLDPTSPLKVAQEGAQRGEAAVDRARRVAPGVLKREPGLHRPLVEVARLQRPAHGLAQPIEGSPRVIGVGADGVRTLLLDRLEAADPVLPGSAQTVAPPRAGDRTGGTGIRARGGGVRSPDALTHTQGAVVSG